MSHSLLTTRSKHLNRMSMHRKKPLRANGRCKKVNSRYRQTSRTAAYKSIPKLVRYTRVGSFRGGAGRKRGRNVQTQYSALKIISYFSDSDSRQVFDAYYGGTTIVQESDYGPEQHFIWTPLTGRSVCRTQNITHAKDSYKMECQTATRNLPGFYDSFCMLYSIYNQARHYYTLPELLPELFTTHDEPFLFNHFYQAIANVPNLNIYQQKELLRLLANRNLLVKLFRQMSRDAGFWNCFKAILKFGWPGWTMAKLKIDFPEAINEFEHYTFEQHGVINELLPQ